LESRLGLCPRLSNLPNLSKNGCHRRVLPVHYRLIGVGKPTLGDVDSRQHSLIFHDEVGRHMRTFFRSGLFFLAFVLTNAHETRADYISSELGPAGPSNYAILALSGTNNLQMNGPGTTTGNVGINSAINAGLNSSNHPRIAINGNVYLATGASVSNPAQVNGTIFTNQNSTLGAANTAAVNAASDFSKLSPTTSITTGPGGNLVLNAAPNANGVTVASVPNGINLGNGQTLTLNGPAGSQFVINSPTMTLNSGKVVLPEAATTSCIPLAA
jgi:hypothetical protein